MKIYYLLIACLLASAKFNAQQAIPSDKVKAAISAKILSTKSSNDIELLNAEADYLCWFEDVKTESTDIAFQLIQLDGSAVTLSDADLNSFNPLIYQLPRSEKHCENLLIITSEGNEHLLIVRSNEMMRKQVERLSVKQSKAGSK